jgi:hypothetical protein
MEATAFNVWQTFAPLGLVLANGSFGVLPPLASDCAGVGQPAIAAVVCKLIPPLFGLSLIA